MSLTKEDLRQIGDLIAASEERTYRRIKDNALGEITTRLDTMDGRLGGLSERVDSMVDDLAKVMERTDELPLINQNVEAIRNHLGI